MPRTRRLPRLATLAATLLGGALVAAACAPANNPPAVPVQAGGKLVTQVVAQINDAGRMPAAAVDRDGNPAVSYLLLKPNLVGGALPPPPIPNAAQPPAVVVATFSSQQGYWSRQSASPQDYTKLKGLSPEVADPKGKWLPGVNTAIAVDGDGNHHVVWATPSGVFYTDDAPAGPVAAPSGAGAQPAAYLTPAAITKAAAVGASIAVTDDGTPFVSYVVGTAVKLATRGGKTWTERTIARVTSCPGCLPVRTAIQLANGTTPVVAYVDGGKGAAMVAVVNGSNATTTAIGTGGGFGISLALDAQGTGHVAYYGSDGSVFEADSPGPPAGGSGGSWTEHRIGGGAIPSSADTNGFTTGIGVDGSGRVSVTWVDPPSGRVMLTSGSAGSLPAGQPVPGSLGGVNPALAVSADGRTLVVPFYDAADAHLNVATPVGGELTLAVPSPLAAPPPSPASTGLPCSPTGATTLAISAANIAFDVSCLAAPPETAFTIDFDNQDAAGVPHNVDIYKDPGYTQHLAGANGPSDIVTAPAKASYKVTGLPKGIYYFKCDIHPTMTGLFVVANARKGAVTIPSPSP